MWPPEKRGDAAALLAALEADFEVYATSGRYRVL